MAQSSARTTAWPEDGLESPASCPACGATGRHVLHDGLTDRLFGSPGRWTLWRCARCRSAHLDPRPTPATVGLAYADYFWHQPPRDLEAAPPASAVADLRRAVRNAHLNRSLGYDLQVSRRVPPAGIVGRTAFGAAIDRWARHLRWPGRGARLLDVGCANGEFLLQMRALGWEARGIDIDDAALEQGRAAGLRLSHGTLTDPRDVAGETFDAITLNHVIEHLHDPFAALRGALALLRPGGTVWIATPNIDSLAHRAFGRDWLSLDPPRHLVLFAPDALHVLVRKAGFIDVREPRPVRNAASVYAASAALARGERPANSPVVPLSQRVRAVAAERWWEHRRAVAEELIVMARTPGAV